MPLDLLAPLFRALPAQRTPWPTIPGETAYGKIQPGNYRLMVKADSSWVYACARVNAQAVAKVKMRLYRKLKDGEREEIDEHPFIDLLRNVNSYMNEFELKELTTLMLELTGNAYWYLAPTRLLGKNGRMIPGEIWPLLAQYMRIVPGRQRMIDGFLYQLPQMAQPIAFGYEEIVHFKYPHPDNVFYGKGCVEGGHYAIDSNEFQKRYEIALFKNMARPDGVLSTEQELTDTQAERLRAQWQSLYGGVDRSGNVAILEKGLKYENTAFNPKELDYLRGRIATREEICATFGVPAAKLGIVDDVNRANGEAVDYTYQSNAVEPRCRRIEQKVNEQITPIYDDALVIEFDNPVPENNEAALIKTNAYLDRGVIVINEIREQNGEDPVPWGDKPFSMVSGPVPVEPADPADAVDANPDDNPPKDDDDEDEDEKAIAKASADDVKRRYRFVRLITPQERRFYRDLQDYFVQQRRIVESNLDNYRRSVRSSLHVVKQDEPLLANILFPKAKETERLAKRAQPFVEQAVKLGADFGLSQTGSAIDFDVLNPLVVEAVKRRVSFFSKRVTDNVAQALTDEIAEGIMQGETISQIATRIDEVYDQLLGYRSLRIARTETVSASNNGALLSYKAVGIEKKKWLTANDEHVRESHERAEGQTVKIGQPFNVGGVSLDHPGDPSGPPEEIINCRCFVEPIIERGG